MSSKDLPTTPVLKAGHPTTTPVLKAGHPTTPVLKAGHPTTPVLKAGHPGVSCYICLSRLWLGRLLYVYTISFLSVFLKLVCYAHVFPCIYICSHPHSHVHTLTHSCRFDLSSISASLILSWESPGVRSRHHFHNSR